LEHRALDDFGLVFVTKIVEGFVREALKAISHELVGFGHASLQIGAVLLTINRR
jgi:hypothetical protein